MFNFKKIKKYIKNNKDQLIGMGLTRDVYHYSTQPNLVIKVERNNNRRNSFQNVKEYLFTKELEYCEEIKHIAKTIDISENGKYIIQEYARDVTDDEWTKFIADVSPSFLTDLKRENVGVIDDRIVVRDYGSSIMTNRFKMKPNVNRIVE